MACSMLVSRKRPHSPDFLDEHSCVHNGCHIKYVLESESPRHTDEDSESSLSVQMASTVSAKDTSDTSWSSDESVTMDVQFEEYDVASISQSDEKLMSNCDSSGSDELMYTATAATVFMATNFCEDRDLWADSSDLDSDTTDSEVPRADYWECARCKNKCSPLTRYCIKCFQLRKGYFPERPKRTRPRRRRAVASQQSTASAGSLLTVQDTDRRLSPESVSAAEPSVGKLQKGDSGISMGTGDEQCAPDTSSSVGTPTQELLSSQETLPPEGADMGPEVPNPRSELCFMCVERPRNGAFVHKKAVHVLCCYQCSLKVWNRTRKCPLCNNRPQNVAKLIYG